MFECLDDLRANRKDAPDADGGDGVAAAAPATDGLPDADDDALGIASDDDDDEDDDEAPNASCG